MAWSESGIYGYALAALLGGTGGAVGSDNWVLTTNKFFLTNTSDTPSYFASLASSIYATTYEVTGTGWSVGGVLLSALAAGSTSLAPTLTVSASGATVVTWGAQNISVSGTTLTGVLGGYFYQPATTVANSKIIGIYFGGTAYATVAGIFGVTWSGGNIATIQTAS